MSNEKQMGDEMIFIVQLPSAEPSNLRCGVSIGSKSNSHPANKKLRPQGPGLFIWLRELDLNQRPSGYEPDRYTCNYL